MITVNINCFSQSIEFRDLRGWATPNPSVNPNGIPTNITSFSPLLFTIFFYNGSTVVLTMNVNALPAYSGMPAVPSMDIPLPSISFTHLTFELIGGSSVVLIPRRTVYYTCNAYSCLLEKISENDCGCEHDNNDLLNALMELFIIEKFPYCFEHEYIIDKIKKIESICSNQQ